MLKNKKKMKKFDNIEISQLNFIKKFKLKFIILRRGVKYPTYLHYIIKEVITDKKSGDRFIMLKNN